MAGAYAERSGSRTVERIEQIMRAGSPARHRTNAWKFDAGTFLDPSGWSETTAPLQFTPACLQAYLAAGAGMTTPPMG